MKKGFTLIEGIIVIAIVAVLVFLAVTTFSGVDTSNQGTIPVAQAETYPEPTNYAVDTAGVLTKDQLATLNETLKAVDASGKTQTAVAIVKTTAPLTIEQYGIKLAEKWKVGYKGLDNGTIIIVATEDRKVRLEVGHGLEGDIPDAVAGRIIDENMIPSLKKGDWYNAVLGAINGINNRLK